MSENIQTNTLIFRTVSTRRGRQTNTERMKTDCWNSVCGMGRKSGTVACSDITPAAMMIAVISRKWILIRVIGFFASLRNMLRLNESLTVPIQCE